MNILCQIFIGIIANGDAVDAYAAAGTVRMDKAQIGMVKIVVERAESIGEVKLIAIEEKPRIGLAVAEQCALIVVEFHLENIGLRVVLNIIGIEQSGSDDDVRDASFDGLRCQMRAVAFENDGSITEVLHIGACLVAHTPDVEGIALGGGGGRPVGGERFAAEVGVIAGSGRKNVSGACGSETRAAGKEEEEG